jgi:hypothetical protein
VYLATFEMVYLTHPTEDRLLTNELLDIRGGVSDEDFLHLGEVGQHKDDPIVNEFILNKWTGSELLTTTRTS